MLYYKKYIKHFSVLIYSYHSWKLGKLEIVENTSASGRCVSTQFPVIPISYITVYVNTENVLYLLNITLIRSPLGDVVLVAVAAVVLILVVMIVVVLLMMLLLLLLFLCCYCYYCCAVIVVIIDPASVVELVRSC